MRNTFVSQAAGILAAAVLTAGIAATSAVAQPVKIGISAAFSGPEAFLGNDTKRGVDLAVEQLKSAHPDVTYQVVIADDECTPAGGAAAFRRLIDVEKVDVILGSACSGATLGGMPVLLQSAAVSAMTYGATNPKISAQSGVGGNPYMWRMNLDDLIIGQTFAKFIASAGVKTIAVLSQNNDFGRGAAAVYQAALPQNGVKVITTEYFAFGASDLRPQLTKINDLHPDGLLFFGEAPDCALLVRQKHELGMATRLFTRGACATDEGIKLMGDAKLAEGVVEGSYWVRTPSQPMIEQFNAKYGEYPPYNSGLGYYAMFTVDQAVRQGGGTAEGITKGLAKVDWSSAIGPIKFDEHHQAHPNLFLVTIADGALKVMQEIPTQQ